MNTILPAEPYRSFDAGGGSTASLYLVDFDKAGNCTSLGNRRRILEEVAKGSFTDVHVYSHGWNNVFNEATDHYSEFFSEYFKLRAAEGLDDGEYRPLLVGVLWPSTALLSEAERGPGLAGPIDAAVMELADELPAASRTRFLALAGSPTRLEREAALELASLLCPVLELEGRHGEGFVADITPESIVTDWESSATSAAAPGDGRPGTLPAIAPEQAGVVRSAGGGGLLSPKELIRKATVYLMKDRAGAVGANGVSSLLAEILSGSRARVHLTGHSYGAKVVLSALAQGELPREATSVLLLQAAINTYCFASSIPGNEGREGGYRRVLERIRIPLLTTFSSHDSALNDFFPIALRRDIDLGEPRTAGLAGKYAALGAIGPSGMKTGEAEQVAMLDRPARYRFGEARMLALNGSGGAIRSHGDVRNPYTEWALANLVEAGRMQ